MTTAELRAQFLEAALWHGPLDKANTILESNPEIASSDIHVAAVLGDERAVRDFLAADPAAVRRTAPPFDGDPLTYLGLSKYLRLDKDRSDAFVRTATALLDAGADPNAGFWNKGEHETVLYGAAGVAHHGPLTRVLLERGADPNDPEVVYHTPEDWDMDALRAVVETDRLTQESLSLMLLRKHDWHHTEGVRYLLAHGADPNFSKDRWQSPLQHAIQRDNDLPIIELLIDHGADLSGKHPKAGTTGIGLAARRGRGDILQLTARRGRSFELHGVEAVLSACALGDEVMVQELLASNRSAVQELVSDGGQVLAEFAGNDNTRGVSLLLDLGIPVNAPFRDGDGYWGSGEGQHRAPRRRLARLSRDRQAADQARRRRERARREGKHADHDGDQGVCGFVLDGMAITGHGCGTACSGCINRRSSREIGLRRGGCAHRQARMNAECRMPNSVVTA